MPLNVSSSQPPRAVAATLVVDFPVALAAGVVLACAAVAMALGAYWVTRPATDPLTESTTLRAPGSRTLRLPWSAFAGDGVAFANEPVFITTAPADGSLAPAERPSVLYARFVAADARSAPGGLIRRRFRDGTPFEGEDLAVAAPDGRAFWARCPSAGSPAEPGGRCMTEMRFGDTDVQVRFAPALLHRWELLASGVQLRFAPGAEVTR
jgi:hypothetical protein